MRCPCRFGAHKGQRELPHGGERRGGAVLHGQHRLGQRERSGLRQPRDGLHPSAGVRPRGGGQLGRAAAGSAVREGLVAPRPRPLQARQVRRGGCGCGPSGHSSPFPTDLTGGGQAARDFEDALELDPHNAELEKLLDNCVQKHLEVEGVGLPSRPREEPRGEAAAPVEGGGGGAAVVVPVRTVFAAEELELPLSLAVAARHERAAALVLRGQVKVLEAGTAHLNPMRRMM